MAYQSKNPYTREVFASFDYVSDDELEKNYSRANRPFRPGPGLPLHSGLQSYVRRRLSWKNAKKNWQKSTRCEYFN